MAGYGFLQASEEAPLQQQIDDVSEKDESLTSERVFRVGKLSASSERKSQENVGMNGLLDSGSLERKTHEVLGSSSGIDSGCSEKKSHENLGINGVSNPEDQMHGNGGTNEVSYPYSQINRMGLHGSVTGLATEPQSTPAFCIVSEKHFTNGAFDIAPCNGGIGKDSNKGPDAISGSFGEDFCKDTNVMNGGTSEGFGRDPMDSNGGGICGDPGNDCKGINNSGIGGVSLEESSIPQVEEPRACSKQVESGSEKKRRSRWEPRDNEATETQEESSGQSGGKKRSRWAPQESNPIIGQVQLPDFFKDLTGGADLDPEVQAMNLRLLDINQRLQTGQVLEEREDGMRSPSPEPIYDNMGIRINTREYRAREQLTRERQELICELIKKNPAFKAPADYRPPKLSKKLYIPMKEYPGYNFIGLIIGPRGNTQKRMQKETGAKIVIRGKGSIKEGRSQQKKDFGADCGENDDLHVYVEADNANSLEQAVSMVEKLLSPVDELQNEHKKAQLRELAALNGTMCENEICRLCGEPGHRHYMCPSKNSTFKSDVSCRICGDGGHPTIDCPVKNSTGASKMDDEYASFLAEVGGGQKAITSSTNPQNVTQGQTPYQSNPNAPVGGSSSAITPFRPGLGSMSQPHPSKEIDEANLYVGYLPLSVDDQGLINLFSPFGKIEDYKLIKDRVTGWSKGYGFVKFSDAAAAAQAVTHMNGYRLDGKVLAVRVAGRPPPPLPPQATPFQSNNTIGYSPHSNQQPPPMMSGNLMSSPPPWSIMPQAPPNPYGLPPPPPPPPGNNYFANPPPPGAQQGVLYPYPSGFIGNQPPPSGYMGGPIQGPPTNVNMNVNPNIPPVPGMMPTLTNGISPEIPQYSQGIPQYSQEIPQYSQDYYGVPPPPPPPSSSTPSAGVQQQRGDVVETEYEKFMSEMRH